jgi:Arm DNA-binding domain
MGLGPLHCVALAEARERARKARNLLLDGIDPLEHRRAQRDTQRREAAENVTCKEAAQKF